MSLGGLFLPVAPSVAVAELFLEAMCLMIWTKICGCVTGCVFGQVPPRTDLHDV